MAWESSGKIRSRPGPKGEMAAHPKACSLGSQARPQGKVSGTCPGKATRGLLAQSSPIQSGPLTCWFKGPLQISDQTLKAVSANNAYVSQLGPMESWVPGSQLGQAIWPTIANVLLQGSGSRFRD